MKLRLDAFTTTSLSPEEMNPIMGGLASVQKPSRTGVDITATTGADGEAGGDWDED